MKQARAAGQRSLLALAVLLPALGGAGCAAMGQVMEEALELNPEKTLTQALLRTPAQWERSLRQARQVHAQVQREYGARLVEQSYVQERLQQIAEKLVAVSHFKGLPVKICLLEDNTLNAFNTGGGYIYVHTGLVNKAGSEDELAFVLGHELGHAMGDHVDRTTLPTLTVTLAALLAAKLTKGQTADQVIGTVHQYLTSGYSRRHERESDVLGTLYALRAGYNPLRGADFFIRVAREEEEAREAAEKALRGVYATYAAAAQECNTAAQQYRAYAQTLSAPYYYALAQGACQQADAHGQRYEQVQQQYVRFAQGLSPLFRSHPVNEERLNTLKEVASFLAGRQVRLSTEEAAYTLRAIRALRGQQ